MLFFFSFLDYDYIVLDKTLIAFRVLPPIVYEAVN